MKWLILAIAIGSEIIGTMQIGTSEGFAKNSLRSGFIVIISYSISLVALSILIRMKLMEMSVAYAVWVALGVAVVSVLSAIWLKETMPALKILFLSLIMIGTVGLNLLGNSK